MYKTDIFALGVILFSLVTDRLPFEYATSQNWLYNLI
jgi:serine/threonine protein kinase